MRMDFLFSCAFMQWCHRKARCSRKALCSSSAHASTLIGGVLPLQSWAVTAPLLQGVVGGAWPWCVSYSHPVTWAIYTHVLCVTHDRRRPGSCRASRDIDFITTVTSPPATTNPPVCQCNTFLVSEQFRASVQCGSAGSIPHYTRQYDRVRIWQGLCAWLMGLSHLS